jgi:hypothetical protein
VQGAEHRFARQRAQRRAVTGCGLRHAIVDRRHDRRRRPRLRHGADDLRAGRVLVGQRAEHARAVFEHVVPQLAHRAGDVREQGGAPAQGARHRAAAPPPARDHSKTGQDHQDHQPDRDVAPPALAVGVCLQAVR